MKIIRLIQEFLRGKNFSPSSGRSVENSIVDKDNQPPDTPKNDGENWRVLENIDGMSTGTLKIVVERNLPENFIKNYNLAEVENKGRYYLAKIIGENGDVIDQLLVDKLNSKVQSLKGILK